MAFRGVGGKKPDEGRGDWASRHLKSKNHPKTIDHLFNKVGNKNHSYFLINQVSESFYDFPYENLNNENFDAVFNQYLEEKYITIGDFIQGNFDDYREHYYTRILKEVLSEKIKFSKLKNDFKIFLQEANIEKIHYHDVFYLHWNEIITYSGGIEWYAQNTIIPSEDLEIVLAATLIHTNIFLTTDRRLKTCLYSLGLNSHLDVNSIRHPDELEEWLNENDLKQ